MMEIRLKRLPHDGIIPGARGHKKIVIPKGTAVYVIMCGSVMFWCAYLNEASAQKCLDGLRKSLDSSYRRHIPLSTMLAFNFQHGVPARVHREKADG